MPAASALGAATRRRRNGRSCSTRWPAPIAGPCRPSSSWLGSDRGDTMLAVVLTLLALAGGSIATFFIMDGPRRRAIELRRRLEEERELIRQDRWDYEDRARR